VCLDVTLSVGRLKHVKKRDKKALHTLTPQP